MSTKSIKPKKINGELHYRENEQKLYEIANLAEIKGAYELDGLSPEEQLNFIKDDIIVRVKITKHEIFRIGELLCMAKHVCQQERLHFVEWVQENFDFSYETAKNFMNVYKQCMGIRELAIRLPASILYKISKPGFPDELRDHLITNGNLEKMTNGKFQQVMEKYREGGFDAIVDDVDSIQNGFNIKRQITFTLDICENAEKILSELGNKIQHRAKGIELPAAKEINENLLSAIDKAYNILATATGKSREELKPFESEVWDKVR